MTDEMKTATDRLHDRISELESRPCPYIVTSDEGTSYCSLAEMRIRELEEFILRNTDPFVVGTEDERIWTEIRDRLEGGG